MDICIKMIPDSMEDVASRGALPSHAYLHRSSDAISITNDQPTLFSADDRRGGIREEETEDENQYGADMRRGERYHIRGEAERLRGETRSEDASTRRVNTDDNDEEYGYR